MMHPQRTCPRLFAAAGGLALALAALPAHAQPAQQTQKLTEATDVVVVEVPVQVLRDGEPVRGLTADDFEIWEGRKKQPVTGFEVLDLSAAGPGGAGERRAAVPPSARRRFLLLFDVSFSDPRSIEKARQAARSLVLDGLHPTDLAAVATFQASRGVELVLGFTSDRRQLEAALGRLGEIQKAADPLRLVMTQSEVSLTSTLTLTGAEAGGGGDGGRGRREDAGGGVDVGFMEYVIREGERATQAAQKNNVTQFAESVAALSQTLAAIEGRKQVILLSEGFDSQALYGTQDEGEIQQMGAASMDGRIWAVDSTKRFGNTGLVKEIDLMLEALRRADCVVQAVDIAGMRAPGEEGKRAAASARQDGLFVLADSTGGELYDNFNDLSEAMDEVLKRNSVTYVLSFQPEDLKQDGAFRKLRVELKDGRGAQVVHRPGYYAPKPFAERTALEKSLDTASQVMAGREGGSIATAVLATPFARGGEGSGKAYVPILIEAAGEGLLAGQTEGVLPAEVYVYALGADGQVQDFFARSLALDVAKVAPALRHSGLKMFGDLDLPPGDYSLRVLVRNGATGASSLRVVALQVPSFGDGAPVLLPPLFPEPADRWLLVRESAEPPRDVPYPFMLRTAPYIPAARPDLVAGEEARLSLIGYHLRPGDLRADALILTSAGKEAGAGEIRVLDRETGSAGRPDRILAGFRPPALAPGEYHLLVTLTDPAGASQTSTAPFVIASREGR